MKGNTIHRLPIFAHDATNALSIAQEKRSHLVKNPRFME
jgi:hypothetical protein